MTICRKCGKEIPDGEELCEDCKSQASNSGESYLDELMKSMEIPEMDMAEPEPVKEQELPDIPEMEKESAAEEARPEAETIEQDPADEVPELVLDDMLMAAEDEPAPEEIPDLVLNEMPAEEEPEKIELPELDLGDIPMAEEEPEEIELPELDLGDIPMAEEEPEEAELPELDLGDIPMTEEEPEEAELPELDLGDISMQEEPEPEGLPDLPVEDEMDEPISDEAMPEDINDLLELLSKDYSGDEMDDVSTEDEIAEDEVSEGPVVQDMSAPEVSLFSDSESDAIFADHAQDAGTSVEDIFQDALSAVDDVEDSEDGEGSLDQVFALEGDFDPEEDSVSDESEGTDSENAIPLAQPVKKKEKKNSFWKRIFGNVVTDQTAEEEAREREQEQEKEAERAAAREEKAKQDAADKEAKEAAAQEAKEKKAALKAEQAAAKAAAKEEKKKKKAELAAVEVVGKINPVGATIVMVFFALICVTVIFGTQSLSYTSALKNARQQFEAKDYQAAYESLAGVNVSESSQELADKIRICMQMQKELNSYSNYYEMKMYLESLDSLIKGIRSYDTNKNKADEYEILTQYEELKAKISSVLFSEFGVSETEARAANGLPTQEEYTEKLEEIIRRWEAKNAMDER